MPYYYIEMLGVPSFKSLQRMAADLGFRAWLSNNSGTTTEHELRELNKRIEGSFEVPQSLNDVAIIEATPEQAEKVAESEVVTTPERVMRITRDPIWVFDLLDIGWWERRSGVEKAGVVLTSIAVGLAVTKALEWW